MNEVVMMEKAVTSSRSAWRNTPAQINARSNLASFKVRTAGIPDRFTRGGKRALQSAVLRANAMARATKTFGAPYDESKHPRQPAGGSAGGQFAPKGGETVDADGIPLSAKQHPGWENRFYRPKSRPVSAPPPALGPVDADGIPLSAKQHPGWENRFYRPKPRPVSAPPPALGPVDADGIPLSAKQHPGWEKRYWHKTKKSRFDESSHPRQPAGSDKGGEFAPKGGGKFAPKAHATYPDGRSIPEVGDSVYTFVPGFGGSPAIVEGTVFNSKKGLRVRVTGGISYFGRGPVAGAKTAPLTPGWTLKGEKSPFARKEEEREAKRKADAEAYEAKRKQEKEALAARIAAYQADGQTIYSAGGVLPREGMRVRLLSHDPQYDQTGWVMEVSPPPSWSKSGWTVALSDDKNPTNQPRTTGNLPMVELPPDPNAPPPPDYVKMNW